MALPRQKFRELVFQLLYGNDFIEIDKDYFFSIMMKMLKTTKKNVTEAYNKILKIEENLLLIDEKIKSLAVSYDIERIPKIELTILRLSFYDIFFEKELPHKVVLAEAIRLCNKFGSKVSFKFINAIIDAGLKQVT